MNHFLQWSLRIGGKITLVLSLPCLYEEFIHFFTFESLIYVVGKHMMMPSPNGIVTPIVYVYCNMYSHKQSLDD